MTKWTRFALYVLLAAGVLGIVIIPGGIARAGSFSWDLPAAYTDNTAIPPSDQAQITVEVYESAFNVFDNTMTPILTSAPGATSSPGNAHPWYYYSAKAVLYGVKSGFSGSFYYVPGVEPPGRFKYNQ